MVGVIKITLETQVHGSTFTDTYTKYPCRHMHHKYDMDGSGPKRARRVKKGSFHYERGKKLLEAMTDEH